MIPVLQKPIQKAHNNALFDESGYAALIIPQQAGKIRERNVLLRCAAGNAQHAGKIVGLHIPRHCASQCGRRPPGQGDQIPAVCGDVHDQRRRGDVCIHAARNAHLQEPGMIAFRRPLRQQDGSLLGSVEFLGKELVLSRRPHRFLQILLPNHPKGDLILSQPAIYPVSLVFRRPKQLLPILRPGHSLQQITPYGGRSLCVFKNFPIYFPLLRVGKLLQRG